jgi:arylsulfatase A-like enzyme
MASTDRAESRPHEDRPNIVLMVPHDCGREFGCYDRQAYTPQLDALAQNGALLEQHFCPTPSCAPSRASIATGLQPHNHGMLGHPFTDDDASYPEHVLQAPQLGWEIHEGIFTLPMYLSQRDYVTYLVGDIHSSKQTHGHHHYPDHPDRDRKPNGYGAREAADLMEQIICDEARSSDPFYIEAKTANAHRPFSNREGGFKDDPISGYSGPGPEDVDLSPYFPNGIESTAGYDEAAVRQDFADFYEDLYELDTAVGRILETLEETGQRENTVFVITADHGVPHTMIPQGKVTNYDGGIEAAALWHYPGHIEGGERYSQLTSHVDILPTLLDLVDGQPPTDIDGHSFRPLVDAQDDRSYDEREAIFAETTYNGGPFYDPVRAIRTQEYKLLRDFWPQDIPNAPREMHTELELYDLETDPEEQENVAGDPAYAAVREALYDRLRRRLERDHDPILDGPIPPQQGAFDVRI